MIMVTGATGFVGRALVHHMTGRNIPLRATMRAPTSVFAGNVEQRVVGTIDGGTDWGASLAHVDTVIHLAARAHILRETAGDPLDAFRQTNVEGTRRLLQQAGQAGVRRFVFVSSIAATTGISRAAGETATPITAHDTPRPETPYGRSKLEAENLIQEMAPRLGMQWVILRPPLVYGAGAPGNFATMAAWVRRGIPLPLASFSNRRSLIGIDNLVDILLLAARHPAASNRVLMVSDGEDVSTADLFTRLARAMQRPSRLWSFPPQWLLHIATLAGKGDKVRQLMSTLLVDSSETRTILGWKPPLSLDEGLRRACGNDTKAAH